MDTPTHTLVSMRVFLSLSPVSRELGGRLTSHGRLVRLTPCSVVVVVVAAAAIVVLVVIRHVVTPPSSLSTSGNTT
jgi:hypothetical protein